MTAPERARAAYWEARCRLAVEALTDIRLRERWDEDGIRYRLACVADCVDRAEVAIAAIGPLPEQAKTKP